MRRIKAQPMGMFSGKSQTPLDSTYLPDSATFGGAAGLIVLSVYVSHVHTTRTLGICFEWVYTTDPPPALSGSKTGEHVARAA